MNIFNFKNYRSLMKAQLEQLPNNGYGELAKAAKSMGIAPSLLTSVMKEEKHFTPEQAFAWSKWSQWTNLESDYFVNLVQWERAGTDDLKKYFETKMSEINSKSNILKQRMPPKAELPEQEKAIFYSDWLYSAVRLTASLKDVKSADNIAKELNISRKQVARVLEFLIQNNLVIEDDLGLRLGTQTTHIGADEPLVSRHHTNWRLKAIEKFSKDPTQGLFFTSPVSLSKNDFEIIKKIIIQTLDSIFKIIEPSPEEKVACLNLDWFLIGKDNGDSTT